MPKRVLFLLSRVLGGKTFSAYVLEALKNLPEIDPVLLTFEEGDYARYGASLPFFVRKSGLFRASFMMQRKVRELEAAGGLEGVEGLFIQSFELLPYLKAYAARYPTVVAHDATHLASYRLIARQNLSEGGSRLKEEALIALKSALTTPVYRRAVAEVEVFMPRTSWCADSLRRDFGVDPDRILVTPAGLDVEAWKPAWAQEGPASAGEGLPEHPGEAEEASLEPKRLLFVGNDFERKGGYFLLRLFSRYVYPHAELHIVSNDPALEGFAAPPGIVVHRGLGAKDRDRLLALYRSARLFVYPTRKDQMGMVLTEAAAAGLPLLASDIGGVSEICRDGENGFLMPYDADEEAFASRILLLLRDTALWSRFAAKSRELARLHLSREAMTGRLSRALSLAEEVAAERHPVKVRQAGAAEPLWRERTEGEEPVSAPRSAPADEAAPRRRLRFPARVPRAIWTPRLGRFAGPGPIA